MSAARTRKKAGRKRKASGPSGYEVPRGTRFGLLLLRLWTGGFFLATAGWKLLHPQYSVGEQVAYFRDEEYVDFLEAAIAHPPRVFGESLDVYARFLEQVMLPGKAFFAPAILFFEALLGIGLVLGLGVRFLAGLGLVLMMAFNLGKPGSRDVVGEDPVGVPLFSVGAANWPVTLVLLLLVLAAAGRFFGLDAWLHARGPRWLRWMG